MADSEGMRRLILHAADQLAAASLDHDKEAARLQHELTYNSDRLTYAAKARTVIAGMVLAESTLRMVAACMATESEALSAAREARRTAPRDASGKFVAAPKEGER